MINTINMLKAILAGQNPDTLYKQMVNNNPRCCESTITAELSGTAATINSASAVVSRA